MRDITTFGTSLLIKESYQLCYIDESSLGKLQKTEGEKMRLWNRRDWREDMEYH